MVPNGHGGTLLNGTQVWENMDLGTEQPILGDGWRSCWWQFLFPLQPHLHQHSEMGSVEVLAVPSKAVLPSAS